MAKLFLLLLHTILIMENIFPLINQGFGNFQYSKAMSNILLKIKLVNSMSQAPNFDSLLSRSKFESQQSHHLICVAICQCKKEFKE